MNERIEVTKKFSECLLKAGTAELGDILADDVVLDVPLMGVNTSGKGPVQGYLAGIPIDPTMTWSDPVEDGETVKSIGKGSPFGDMKIVLSFSADGKISRIEAGLGA